MSKLSLSDLKSISESAHEVMLAIAGNHNEVSPNNSGKMCELWDDLNDRHAPPEVVKSMADELIAIREQQVPVAWQSVSTSSCNRMVTLHKEMAED